MLDTVTHMDALAFLRTLPDASVHCCITSPPYFGLRDYGADGQIGLEPTPAAYVARMVEVFREVRRVLREDGTAWINLGDSYSSVGHAKSSSGYGTTGLAGGIAQEHSPLKRENNGTGKHKDLIGIPWRVAFALQDDGWWLRSDIIWAKGNPMPESVTDRPTRAHEYVFLLTKSASYWYDADAIAEPCVAGDRGSTYTNGKTAEAKSSIAPVGQQARTDKQAAVGKRTYTGFNDQRSLNPTTSRNKRSVWHVNTSPYYADAHFATFPPRLIEPMVLAGCPAGGIVLDPFMGSGTTALVARRLGRHYLGCDLSAEYVAMARRRLAQPYTLPMFDRPASNE